LQGASASASMSASGATHTGKTYEHRVPDDEAQAWLDALIFTVKEAKAKTSRSIFWEKYGHNAYSMMRARELTRRSTVGLCRCVHVCVRVCVYVCVYAMQCMHARTHKRTHIHAHMYIYTNTHAHACIET
jgi:hypothetical protein